MEWKMTEEVENVSLAEAYIDGAVLYAIGFDRNILLKYDLEGRKLERLGWFDGFQFPASYQNVGIYKFEDSLFCFSINSYEVAEYNIRTRAFRYYYPSENNCKVGMICSVCRRGEEVWMFREAFDTSVMVFSMEKRSYRQCIVKIKGREKAEHYIRSDFENAVCIDTKIWRCVSGSSEIAVLDTVKQEEYVINTGLQLSFLGMNYEDRLLYIISEDGRNLVVYDTDCGKAVVYTTGYIGAVKIPFIGAAEADGRIFLFPCYEKEIFCYEKDRNELRLIQRLELPHGFKKIHDPKHRSMFLTWKKFNGALWLLPFGGNGMLRLAPDYLQITSYSLKISEGDYFAGIVRYCSVVEEGKMELEDYLKAVEYGMKKDPGLQQGQLQEGEAIWNMIK